MGVTVTKRVKKPAQLASHTGVLGEPVQRARALLLGLGCKKRERVVHHGLEEG